jgi:hypothetical protein
MFTVPTPVSQTGISYGMRGETLGTMEHVTSGAGEFASAYPLLIFFQEIL